MTILTLFLIEITESVTLFGSLISWHLVTQSLPVMDSLAIKGGGDSKSSIGHRQKDGEGLPLSFNNQCFCALLTTHTFMTSAQQPVLF